jgi:hypothetical protein
LAFAPARKFRGAASRAELIRSRCHPAFRGAELCRRLAVLRQRLFERLFDAGCVDWRARLEFPRHGDCARAKGEEHDDLLGAREGDAVGELAKGLRRMLEIQCVVLEMPFSWFKGFSA